MYNSNRKLKMYNILAWIKFKILLDKKYINGESYELQAVGLRPFTNQAVLIMFNNNAAL